MRYFYKKHRDFMFLRLARMLPVRLAYWAFIRVHAESGDCPKDFSDAANHWCRKYKI